MDHSGIKSFTSNYTPTGTGNTCDFCNSAAAWVCSTKEPVRFGMSIDGHVVMEDMGTVWRMCEVCCGLVKYNVQEMLVARSIQMTVGPARSMTEQRYAALVVHPIMVVTHFFEAGPDEPERIKI